ncbi:hypothetical protein D3C80_2093290 [compost metagenome]
MKVNTQISANVIASCNGNFRSLAYIIALSHLYFSYALIHRHQPACMCNFNYIAISGVLLNMCHLTR